MKTQTKKYTTMLVMGLVAGLLFGKGLSTQGLQRTSAVVDELNMPTQASVNINNMVYWMKKSSGGTTSGSPNGTQADYPKGTGGLIYEDGMLWGVKVTDGNSQSPRVGGTTYAEGVKAGRVIYDAAGNVLGATDPADQHIWRVRTDYLTADLSSDADIMGSDVASVAAQYAYDWANWPVAWGAPFDDVDGNGVYDPAVDVPGYPGADQTMWTVANDIPLIVGEDGVLTGDTLNTAPTAYGADPVGVEIQVTNWAYNFAASNPLGNIVFKKATMKYTGLPTGYNDFDPAVAHLDTVYFTQWSDPDLGTYTDDYVGSDIDLSFGYVYNGNALDGVFNGIYQLPVPAGGYDFLQGPITSAGDTLGMTSFTYFGAGSAIGDPDLSDYLGSLQFFNLMEGYLPRPEYHVQTPWTDIATGLETKFVLSGDPVSGEGWVDGVQLPPGDRRLVMASGPFQMNLGDSQDVVLALIGGMGADAISSVTVAKYNDISAQYAYDNDFDLPSAPTQPIATGFEMDKKISIDWGSDLGNVASTEETVIKGFEFEGYNVYQIPSKDSPLSEGIRIATYDKINLLQAIFDLGVDPASGYVLTQAVQYGTDSGIRRYFESDYDKLRNRPMSNGVTYHFAITAYSFNPNATIGIDPFVMLESNPAVVSVTPHDANPGVTQASETSGDFETTHSGTAGGNVSATITNPDELTGDDYEVNFNEQHYYRDLAGLWQMTNYPDSVGRTLGKIVDCSGSSITGAAVASATVGTIDLILSYDMICGDNWVDGLKIDLPDELVINSWSAITDFSYGAASGQNEVNMAGTLDAGTNTISWGDSARTGFGAIERDQTINVNVDASTVTFPFSFSYEVWDDGYDATIVDASGTSSVAELGYDYKTIKHWNLVNTNTGDVLLEDMVMMSGVPEEGIVDGVYDEGGYSVGAEAMTTTEGFYVNVSVGYAAPVNYESISVAGSGSFDIGAYGDYGWAATSKSVDAYGDGYSSVDYLQRDVKVVFDGVYGEADANGYVSVVEGGSQAWIYAARDGDLANHPSPENPGTGDEFLITVPFKVYDMEAGDEPVQISIIIYDRIQAAGTGYDGSYDGDEDGTPAYYAFNPFDRMYTEFVNRPYEETLIDFASNEAYLTWNTVWWKSGHVLGDEVTFVYANPIQQGVDTWSFTSVPNTGGGAVTQDDIDKISVYPNPYYGFHELEESRSDKYVSFNHLPTKATIRIFSFGGTMVKEIKKDDASQFATWDLANQYGYPVASGLYLVHVETEFGEKILKLAVVQETQVLKYY